MGGGGGEGRKKFKNRLYLTYKLSKFIVVNCTLCVPRELCAVNEWKNCAQSNNPIIKLFHIDNAWAISRCCCLMK